MRRFVLMLSVVCWGCGPSRHDDDGGVTFDAGVTHDAGGVDAGSSDAGEVDAGEPDAGDTDAGDVDAGAVDAGTPDAGEPDAGTFDAGEPDAGGPDAGTIDAGPAVPLTGFGDISGECGPLSNIDLWLPTPTTYETRIDFGTMVVDAGLLTDGGYVLWTSANAGGSSTESEAFSFEVLHRCEFADLAATETQVVYVPANSKKTDLVIWLEGEVVGVSVARAFQFPPGTPLSFSEARRIIAGKLSDIQVSTVNVQPPWQWNKQILHVLAYDDTARDAVIAAAASIDAGVRGDTILYITVTDGNDGFIY